jgi:hypothetical protein
MMTSLLSRSVAYGLSKRMIPMARSAPKRRSRFIQQVLVIG